MDKLGLQEGKDGYVWRIKDEDGKIMEVPVSPFIVTPKERIVCEDYCETLVEIDYEQKKYDATFSVKDFSSANNFREAVAKRINPYVWYDVKPKSHPKLLKLLDSKKVKTIKGVNHSGFVKHKNEWCYATSYSTLKKNKELTDEIKILKDWQDLDNKSIILENCISSEEIQKIKNTLLKFNKLGLVGSLLGYVSSTFLKERLWNELNIKFPVMAVIGTPGSGKSATIENVALPILSMEQKQILSAFTITEFTLLKMSSCSNTCPVIINEYKPNELSLRKINLISNTINNSYDRYSTRRGRVDFSMVGFDYKSPLIILGEGFTADQSKRDRFIRLYPSINESQKYTKEFQQLNQYSDELKRLGKQLLVNALNISSSELSTIYNYNLNYINTCNESSQIKQDRGKINLAVVFTGIDFLNQIMGYCDITIAKLKRSIIKTYISDTLEGELTHRTPVHDILEYMDQLAYEGKIISGKHFLNKVKDGVLYLDMPTIFGEVDVDVKNKNRKIPLTQKEFTMQLRKEKMFKDYKRITMPDVGKQRQCYLIDVGDAIFKNLELSNLLGMDLEDGTDVKNAN